VARSAIAAAACSWNSDTLQAHYSSIKEGAGDSLQLHHRHLNCWSLRMQQSGGSSSVELQLGLAFVCCSQQIQIQQEGRRD
jgi:hypothetical protein